MKQKAEITTLFRLAAEQDGLAAIEFAIVAPVFCLLLMGIFDIGQMAYGRSILSGAVEKAARSSAMETADTTAADLMVQNAIKPILPGATFTSTRAAYVDFSDVNRAEKFTDTNNNGTCDAGEPYVDENRSGHWEADVGISGNGGANDVVLYTVTVNYKPVFRVNLLGNTTETRTMVAYGVRKNQPFATQRGYGSSAGTC
ncbi:pilus assembly protein [Novosphingobium sp. G106]|uniref:TadE/TadG family type IV pilus assembly protein n=1 Tax=Novosphingobium sp. G106 TaxID=2849500 RepID=UPI001C2D3594|nr:TadE family protein [Novosphingobium sp. G106]MBV1691210.1 pilus assembly protein [Novosphingobium sp. G106]